MMPLDKHRGIITLHPQLDILPAQPLQLRALALAHRGVAVCLAAAFPGTPVTQRALVDAQLPGHLRDRLARLEHQPHRALLKIVIKLPVLPCHRSSSKRCLHNMRGSPSARTRRSPRRWPMSWALYLEPLAAAIVLSVDEKTQAQALDRTQPLLSLAFDATEKRAH